MTLLNASSTSLDVTDTAFADYRDKKYFGSLDGLRFFCILLVLWLHSPAYFFGYDVPKFLTRGHTGVDFFFVLSGFLITTLLLREEHRNGRISLIGFYKRRALRILPAYLLLVAVVSFFYIVVQGKTEYIAKLPYYLFFTANMLKDDMPLLSIAWSLAVEEQFYFLWPLAILLLSGIRFVRPWLLVVLIVLCLIGGEGLYEAWGYKPYETEQAIWSVHYRGFSAILIGSLMGIALHSRRSFGVLWAVVGHRLTPLLGAAILLCLYQTLPKVLTGWPYSLLHVVMAFIVASIVIREDHAAQSFMSLRWVRRVGQISYGLYLYHLIGLHIANEGLVYFTGYSRVTAPYIVSILMVIVSILLAELSFRYYEERFLRLRNRKQN